MAYQSVGNIISDRASMMSTYAPKKRDSQHSIKGLIIGLLAFACLFAIMLWDPFETKPIVHRVPLNPAVIEMANTTPTTATDSL
jgi:hypothetical protein